LIVEKQYALINTDGKNNCQWAEHIALKIRSLLDDAGPSNMAFTDGPNDVNVNQFSLFSKDDLT
jgi:hypothetical protein